MKDAYELGGRIVGSYGNIFCMILTGSGNKGNFLSEIEQPSQATCPLVRCLPFGIESPGEFGENSRG